MTNLENKLKENADIIHEFLTKILNFNVSSDEIYRPKILIEAIRYGALNGGKRLRPFFVFESTALFNGSQKSALYVGAALEVLHCYSLIHDDLPSMDNDDFRRGKPTIHKAFDEATAILAGDALLTFAFSLLSSFENPLPDSRKISLIQKLSQAAGMGGMIGGQILDIQQKTLKEKEILKLQTMKTALLFRFACESGAIISAANINDQQRMSEFGNALGLAFQLVDDLLDNTASKQTLGKTPGKDLAAKKATLVALHGEKFVKQQLVGLIQDAKNLLSPYKEKAQILSNCADFIINRDF